MKNVLSGVKDTIENMSVRIKHWKYNNILLRRISSAIISKSIFFTLTLGYVPQTHEAHNYAQIGWYLLYNNY